MSSATTIAKVQFLPGQAMPEKVKTIDDKYTPALQSERF